MNLYNNCWHYIHLSNAYDSMYNWKSQCQFWTSCDLSQEEWGRLYRVYRESGILINALTASIKLQKSVKEAREMLKRNKNKNESVEYEQLSRMYFDLKKTKISKKCFVYRDVLLYITKANCNVCETDYGERDRKNGLMTSSLYENAQCIPRFWYAGIGPKNPCLSPIRLTLLI